MPILVAMGRSVSFAEPLTLGSSRSGCLCRFIRLLQGSRLFLHRAQDVEKPLARDGVSWLQSRGSDEAGSTAIT